MLKKSVVKPQALPLRDLQILDQREVPVLLEGTTVDVPAQISKAVVQAKFGSARQPSGRLRARL